MWRRERVIEGVSARAAIELHTALSEAVAAQRAAGRARARVVPSNRGVAARAARDLAQEQPSPVSEDCAVRARLEAKARLYDAAVDAGHTTTSRNDEDACLDFGAMKRARTDTTKPVPDREFLFAEPPKTSGSDGKEGEEEDRKGRQRDAHAVEDVIVEITEEDAATREAKRARHAAALDAVLSENSARAQQDAAEREARRAEDAARIAHIRALQAAARQQRQPG